MGWIGGAISLVKHAGKIGKVVGVVKSATTDPNDDLYRLFESAKRKIDTDGDGVTDLTKKEVVELMAEIIVAIIKRV